MAMEQPKGHGLIIEAPSATDYLAGDVLKPAQQRKNCLVCSKTFVDWKCRQRSYCSHACYSKNIKNILGGRVISNNQRKQISAKLKGHPVSASTRRKLSERLMGRTASMETRRRISNATRGERNGFYGKTHTREVREMLARTAQQMRGDKHYNWKGGITPLIMRVRLSLKMKEWKLAVLERDEFTCKLCGVAGGRLEADHKKEFARIWHENSIKTFEDAMLCTEFWDETNGQTLCRTCHRGKTISFMREYWKNQFTASPSRL